MEWFGGNYTDYYFKMFSFSHFVVLAILVIVASCIFLNRKNFNLDRWRKVEIGVSISLIFMELVYHIWMYVTQSWNLAYSLPLELCSISLILTVILLLRRKFIIYEILLFTALLGASQAILTPVLSFDFPHFRFFHFFYTHSIIIWVPLYFTWVLGYRPTIWSVVKVFIFLNGIMPLILLINKLVNGNYMFLSHKPDGASLLDYLGPHPWYILLLEGVLLSLSLIVWLIFRERSEGKSINNELGM
ncbi:TIGR02206 family membrane protein [Peribacillus alkalitolerans]|uniref:YwaF family protein n=1 Tax=Peribacillus alkalitolerans TaxID=1550385 RepID=UPI0013D87DD5|nr:TIGR02206 family membrane protein [Peribacillus alkalitolerans]